jgi:small conductance mechanosensitive channel
MFLLQASPITEKLTEKQQKIEGYLDHLYSTAIELAPKVLWALTVLIVGLWIINRVAVLADKAMKKKELDISLRTFVKSLVSIGLKIILIVTVVGMLGIGTTSFAAILGAAGLAIGLALQGSLSNFAGGVLILIFKPFKVGDTIEAQSYLGEVKEIQIFNTILLTGDHKTIILPNGPLSNGVIVNNTRFGSLRLDIALAINNNNSIEKANEIIMSVLNANPKVLKDPLPGIFIGKVADGSVNINVKPFCHPDDTGILTSELYRQIYSAFEKNDIKLPPTVRLIQTQ